MLPVRQPIARPSPQSFQTPASGTAQSSERTNPIGSERVSKTTPGDWSLLVLTPRRARAWNSASEIGGELYYGPAGHHRAPGHRSHDGVQPAGSVVGRPRPGRREAVARSPVTRPRSDIRADICDDLRKRGPNDRERGHHTLLAPFHWAATRKSEVGQVARGHAESLSAH